MDYISNVVHAALEVCRRSRAWMVENFFIFITIAIVVIMAVASYMAVFFFKQYLDSELEYRNKEYGLEQLEREDAIRFQCKHYETIYGWDYQDCLTAANIQ